VGATADENAFFVDFQARTKPVFADFISLASRLNTPSPEDDDSSLICTSP
jgi:hypothetical protein